MREHALGLKQDPGDLPEKSSTPVEVVAYDDRWPALYEEESARIREVLGSLLVRIEHVGSTAVPGLAAKPILDIAATISDIERAKECIDPLAEIGYVYMAEFEADLPNRRYFRKDQRPLYRTHHLHMYGEGHEEFESYLVFRDYLRANVSTRGEYEDLKRRLAKTAGRAEYTKSKGPFIVSVLKQAARD